MNNSGAVTARFGGRRGGAGSRERAAGAAGAGG